MYFKTLISLVSAISVIGSTTSSTLANITSKAETKTNLNFVDQLRSFEKNTEIIDSIKDGQNYYKSQEKNEEQVIKQIQQIRTEVLNVEEQINNFKIKLDNLEQTAFSTAPPNYQETNIKDNQILKETQKKAKNYYKWRKSWGIINPCKQKIALNSKVLNIIDKNVEKGLAILGCAISIACPEASPVAAAIILLLIKQWEYNDIPSYDKGNGVILHTYGLPGIPLYIDSVISQ